MQLTTVYSRYFPVVCLLLISNLVGLVAQIPELNYKKEYLQQRIQNNPGTPDGFVALKLLIESLAEEQFGAPSKGEDPTLAIRPYLNKLYELGKELGEPYLTRARIAELKMNSRLCFDHTSEERNLIPPFYKSISDSLGFDGSPMNLELRLGLYVAVHNQCLRVWFEADSNKVISERLYAEPALSDSQKVVLSLYMLLDNMRFGNPDRGREIVQNGLRIVEKMPEAYEAKVRFYAMVADFYNKFTGDYERAEELYALVHENIKFIDPLLAKSMTGFTQMRIANLNSLEAYDKAFVLLDSLELVGRQDLDQPPTTMDRLNNLSIRLGLCRKMDNDSCTTSLQELEALLQAAELKQEPDHSEYVLFGAKAQAGLYYSLLEKNSAAFPLLEDAYALSKKLRFVDSDLAIDFLPVYAALLEERKTTDKALEVNKTLIAYLNYQLETTENDAASKEAFELDVSENKLAKQRAEQESELVKLEADGDRRFYGLLLGGLGLLLLVGGYFFYRSKRDGQRIAEQKAFVEQSLTEKEVLLREIHHRVKNNLQIISGMLTKQARLSADPGLQKMVDEGRERIQSMALIHQNLYESDQLSGVNIRAYLEELSDNIIKSQKGANIELDLKVSDEILDLDTAIPVGLMLNELLTNSYKYAFPEDLKGKVTVALSRQEDDSYEMRVTDNGTGITDQARFKSGKTLGVNLIRGLARQLRGSVEWLERQQGTEVLVRFKAA